MKIFFSLALIMLSLNIEAQDSVKHVLLDTSKAKVVTTDSKTFSKVEFESGYPGGVAAWARFLKDNLHYPNKAVRKRIQGDVVVQFIIDRDGSVSDVLALSGPEDGGLREEAIRVIKISGNWTPAVQNGKKVKSYKKQPISFRLQL
jgi:periplasmic protein TonB